MKDYENMMQPISRGLMSSASNNNISSLLNPISSSQLQQIDQMHSSNSHFDTTSSCNPDEFLEQMLMSSVPNNSSSFPWADDHHQLLLSRGLIHNDVVDGSSITHQANDASVKALLNGFTGSLAQTSNQLPPFQQSQGGTMPAMSQPAASGTSGGGPPRQRVRARRGQATDPHSIAERLRRERIAERMKGLQELVPNSNKTDKASMLDEIIDYVKFLQLQVKVLSMSRLGGASGMGHRATEGKRVNGAQTASLSNNNEGATVTEQQVAKLMEEDMGSAMQYLQGKGLCLMPISLATAMSSANRNPLNGSVGPTSPSLSALTIQSATIAGNSGVGNSVSNT